MPASVLEGWQSHFLNDRIVEGELTEQADEGGGHAALQALHAKCFLFETDEKIRWFLGSANATEAARTRNVEFLVELSGTAPSLKINARLKEWLGSDREEGVFLPFEPSASEAEVAEESLQRDRDERLFEHALLSSEMRGRVEASEGGKNFDLHLSLDLTKVPTRRGLILSVQPLQSGQGFKPRRLTAGTLESFAFSNIAEVDLSRFLHFRIESPPGELRHEFLYRCEIDGLPEHRLDKILKRIIDSRDKFFDYLRFLLSDEISKEDLLSESGTPPSPESAWVAGGDWHFPFPIYEQLLVAASRHPRRLAEVDEVIRHLSEEEDEPIIPDTFLQFWAAFRTQLPKPKPKPNPGTPKA